MRKNKEDLVFSSIIILSGPGITAILSAITYRNKYQIFFLMPNNF